MPRVVFTKEPPHAGSARGDVEVNITERERLLDVCDEAHAPVEFSCRGGTCGTCRVEVLAGADLLEPMTDDERETLEHVGAEPHERLACQARVSGAPGFLHLRGVFPR